MPQADATPYFGEREVAPPMRRQMASPMRADGRQVSDALADRCKGCVPNSLLTSYRTSRTSWQCVPGKTLMICW